MAVTCNTSRSEGQFIMGKPRKKSKRYSCLQYIFIPLLRVI